MATPIFLPAVTSLPSTPHFPDCGAGNCGSHQTPLSFIDPYQVSSGVEPSEYTGRCEGCTNFKPLSQLHRLHCTHALCHACLVMLAQHASEYVSRNLTAIIAHADTARRLYLAAGRYDPSTDQGMMLRRDADTQRNLAAGLMGLTCCQKDTSLCIAKYISCLPPQEAYHLWVAIRLLHTPPHRRLLCGWPDCRRFISFRWGFRSSEGPRWRCVRCRGVSMQTSREGDPVGQLWPARDYSEPDEEPSRQGDATAPGPTTGTA